MDLVDNYSFSVIQCYWIRAASSELIGSVCCPLCAKYILDFVLLVLFCIREINSSSSSSSGVMFVTTLYLSC